MTNLDMEDLAVRDDIFPDKLVVDMIIDFAVMMLMDLSLNRL